MKLMIPFDCTRLIFAILYIASFAATILFPNLYCANHIAILAVLAILTLIIVYRNRIHQNIFRDALLIAATTGLIEGCIGLFRVGYLPTITGTFDNPTLYAMAVSLSIPALLYFLNCNNKIVRYLIYICFAVLFVAIVLSESRTGILCMCMAGLFQLKRICKINFRYFAGICAILITLLLLFMLCSKKDSTTGRSFILSQSFEMIKDKPFGWGQNGFAKHYMDYQADFFRQNSDEKYAYLADNIRHPLNEFVLVTINWGIIGLLLMLWFVSAITVWIYKKQIKEKGVILLFIFMLCLWALFAYPSTLPFVGLFAVVYFFPLLYDTLCSISRYAYILTIVGVSAIVYTMLDCKYRHEWEKGVTLCKQGKYEESLLAMARIEDHYKDDDDFLYSYATVLYNYSLYEQTISVLQRYKEHRTSYEAQLMLANSYMYTNQLVDAEKAYITAHHMCPVRFIPLYNLFKIYKQIGDIKSLRRIGNQILSKEIKVYSPEIEIIRHNTEVELQRLSQHEN